MRFASLALALLLSLAACGDDDGDDPTPDAGTPDMPVVEDDAFVPTEPDICDELGLDRTPFQTGGDAALGEGAGDFTVQTTEGPWVFSEEHTGCESYVFVFYGANDYGNQLWSSVPDNLFTAGPRNAHYFVATTETDAEAITARLATMQTALEEGFEFQELSEADRAFWRAHVHFVTEPIQDTEGSVGALVQSGASLPLTFAIDRDQRFDPMGSLFAVRSGGFVADIGMAAYGPHWFDYLHDLESRLATETDVAVVPLVDEDAFTERVFERTATLPDLDGFDSLEVDVELHCHLDSAGCSEWDRIAHVFLCVAEGDEPCAETRELVRWITPYSRPGRRHWVMDASPMLPLLASGEQTFQVVLGPDWEEATARDVNVSLRLGTRAAERAIQTELAFTGGAFDAEYNTGRAPVMAAIPADATKVELVVLVSGHGQTDGDNCAEWCDHVHTFTANGAEHRIDFPGQAGQRLGCAERASEGVVPGQWGNWAPLRAGWCPGLPVAAQRIDITADVTAGATAELTYRGSFDGGEPRGGDMVLSAYVVAYR